MRQATAIAVNWNLHPQSANRNTTRRRSSAASVDLVLLLKVVAPGAGR
jgi:hypothetical protein